jgi:hypothetical protein
MMADGVKALAGDSDIATRDIAELVAEALVEEQPSPIAAARAV